MAFGSKLNQATITASDFNPEILNNPDRTTNFATKIEVLQHHQCRWIVWKTGGTSKDECL
jgi:hypothetical protein